MARNRIMSETDFTRTQLAFYFVIVLLAWDTVNPVKIFLHVFPSVYPWHIAALAGILFTYVWISEMKAMLYFGVKVFFHSILSIFFREVEIVGHTNIPRYGPVIFTSNHANQFIDAVTLLCTCEHKLSYLIAEKSWNRRIIGDIAWALDAVPVRRAQDSAKKGTGQITLTLEKKDVEDSEEAPLVMVVKGENTIFTSELSKGDKIRPPGTSTAFKIISIESDTELRLDGSDLGEFVLPDGPVSFDLLKRVDQKVVYEKVLDKLASGGSIGIFPEGGSHDRTDLLPLKVGVALIAYSALEKDGLNIPIVPVGLNYFRAYRFRGRAVVEYGTPTYIDPKTLGAYAQGGLERRRVCNELLERIEDSMRSVIVSTPDYETLQLVHTARRLYQRKELLASEKQDLNRRFAEGYKRLLKETEGKPPQEFLDLQERIIAYQTELSELGIRDHQVPGLSTEKYDMDPDNVLREMRLPYQIMNTIGLLALAAIPAVFLNLPVGMVARLYALRRRKKALANSKVKIKGLDVMLSEKVLLCTVMVPSLWVFYGFLLARCTNLDGPAIALVFMSFPLFSYMGIMVAEAGMIGIKDLRPYVMRIFPSTRRRLAALPETRRQLQADLRKYVREIGPALLGELYYGKKLDWASIQEQSRLESVKKDK